MKGYLFDQNVPSRLEFSPALPVSSVTVLGPNPTDSQVWEHAKRERLVIVSKDTDFSDRIIVNTPPPWVVHLRFGNLRRRDYHALLAKVWPQVGTLLKSHKLVNVYADHVEGIS
jgi:predicted nuclease of predicted toxin-antitoxin system